MVGAYNDSLNTKLDEPEAKMILIRAGLKVKKTQRANEFSSADIMQYLLSFFDIREASQNQKKKQKQKQKQRIIHALVVRVTLHQNEKSDESISIPSLFLPQQFGIQWHPQGRGYNGDVKITVILHNKDPSLHTPHHHRPILLRADQRRGCS